jgi:hypothetical protein
MAYTLPADSYGSGKINGPRGWTAEPPNLPAAPAIAPLALAEARVSQVEAELRLALVETQASCLEEDCPTLRPSLMAFCGNEFRGGRSRATPRVSSWGGR